MKKLFGITLAALLVFGMTGPAAAYFENTNLHFVAYEEQDNASPNNSDSGSVEMHYDLGNTQTDWVMPWLEAGGLTKADLPSAPWTTAIDIDDYDTGDWSDVYVGVYGRIPGTPNTVLGIDPDTFVVNTSSAPGFSAFVGNTAYGDANQTVSKTKGAGGSYTYEGLGGDDAGTYAQLINANEGFDAEMRLDAAGSGAIDLWYGYNTNEANTWEKMGTLSASIDGGVMQLDFTPVPVPASVLLLGSGLLGLFGIRRRRS